MTVEVASSTASDATAASLSNFSQSAGCSMEQIFTPVSIQKGGVGPTPGFRPPVPAYNSNGLFAGSNIGPTIAELNPYFPSIFGDDGTAFISNTDYNVVVSEPASDLNLKKNTARQAISTVRTQGLRGPLILSGWGFALDDTPVPKSANNPFSFDPNLVNQRSYWKTGPVHLMWDEQRQVWAGGHQVLCGVLSGKITAPDNPLSPTTFAVSVLRRNPSAAGVHAGVSSGLGSLGEAISVVNRDPSLSYDGNEPDKVFVIAIRLNYEWLPLWVGCPDKA
jgi:hypothetical protein